MLTSKSPAQTVAIGESIGRSLWPGTVIALTGSLGAGKTYFTKGVATGLGVADPRCVTSPTFVLLHEYPARLPIYHFDAYRLTGPEELWDIGCDEAFYGPGVSLVEWADRVLECLPDAYLSVTITVLGPSERRLELAANGERYVELLTTLGLGSA